MIIRACLILLTAILSSCALPTADRTPVTQNDGKPQAPLTAEQVADAIPRAEPILATGNSSPYVVRGKEYTVLATAAGYREQGIASWYGSKFHGRKTANGEDYDAYAASAAHRSLPLPTYARVTNLDNQRSVVLKINDRGPFHSERLIDLSYGAAVRLGFSEQGTANVEIVALSVEGTEDLRHLEGVSNWQRDYRFVQVGAFTRAQGAENMQKQLYLLFADVPIVTTAAEVEGRTYYRVRLGPVQDRQTLLEVQQKMIAAGYSGAKLVAQ